MWNTSQNCKMQILENIDECLHKRGLIFNDDLVYNEHCPQIVNNPILEFGIQKLNKENTEIYNKFKNDSRLKKYGPLEIVYDKDQGYIVKTTAEIKPNTIISEYVDEVFPLLKALFKKNNDSVFELIHSPISDTSLVVIPEKFGNLSKFLSGINNSIKNKNKMFIV